MKARQHLENAMEEDKGLWSSLHLAMVTYARKCRNSYLSMFSI